jgi:hypothetical protein
MRVCAIGRAVSGNCRGRYALLLGDWSLDGPPGSPLNADYPFQRTTDDPPSPYTRHNHVEPPVANNNDQRNWPYKQMAWELFKASGAGYHAGQPGLSASLQMAKAMEPTRKNFSMAENLYNERQPHADDLPPAQDGEDFAFSYAGPERGSQDVFPTSCPPCHFNTNGTATVDGPREGEALWLGHRWIDVRRPCFLGLECN